MEFEQLKLENQLCFPVYAASRLIIRKYQPFLDKLGITYPQYLVLLVLWEKDNVTVNDISQKLILNTNTITPLLKRMESQGIIIRQRSKDDERKVLVQLSEKGIQLQTEASKIPIELGKELLSKAISIDDISTLKVKLNILIDYLNNKK